MVWKMLASCCLFSLAAAAVHGSAFSLREEGDADRIAALARAQTVAHRIAGLPEGGASPEPLQVARLSEPRDAARRTAPDVALSAARPGIETELVALPPGPGGREIVGPPTAEDAAWIAAWEADAEDAVHLGLLPSAGIRAASRADASRNIVIKRGDTMMHLMERATIPRNQAIQAIQAMRKIYDPRRIVPGQKLTIDYTASDADLDDRGFLLRRVHLTTAVGRAISVDRKDKGQYRARKIKTPLKTELGRAAGAVRSSLYVAAQAVQLPPPVMIEFIRIYSWDVDFQRDLRPGDTFEVAWEKYYTSEGEFVGHGDIVFGSMTLSGAVKRLYRFAGQDGSGYFDEKGASARKPLLRTPIDGARLSSSYGRRRHPILGYTLMHRGTDFAARPGTPVFAAGDGRIGYAGRNGAYGKYVRIRHNSRYQTAYAHLRSIRRGIRPGRRVKQGQVIGYLGSTGRSTGPHLHYEVLMDNRQVDPMKVRMPPRRTLRGKELASFQAYRGALDRQIAGMVKDKTTTLSRR